MWEDYLFRDTYREQDLDTLLHHLCICVFAVLHI